MALLTFNPIPALTHPHRLLPEAETVLLEASASRWALPSACFRYHLGPAPPCLSLTLALSPPLAENSLVRPAVSPQKMDPSPDTPHT